MTKEQIALVNEASRSSENAADLIRKLAKTDLNNGEKTSVIENFLRKKAWQQGIPLFGKFELTPLCNLDCKMCYVHLTKEQVQGKQLLTVGQWKTIIKEAVDEGMLYATLTGGECLTYAGFEELYLYLHSLGVQVIVFTNGILLKEEKIEFFKKHPPKLIQISVYGSSEDAYQEVTGHRRFESVMQTIELIQAAGLPLQIAVTPSIFMKDTEDVIRLLDSKGVVYNINASLFDPCEDTGRSGQNADLDRESYLNFYKLKAQLKGRELKKGSEENLPEITDLADDGKGLLCGAGRSGFTINYKGTMLPCSSLREKEGYPLAEGFKAAWKQINQFAVNYPRPVECESCKYQGVCVKCVAEHKKDAAIGHASKRVCEWGKRLVQEGFGTH